MVKSFKYRLRPTKKQEQILLAHIDKCRILYNQLLCARIQAWKNENKSLSQYDQTKTIPLLKQQHAAFKQVYSQVLQQVSARVDLAFKGFFRRLKEKSKTGEKAGFPRYKNENRYDSITYPQFANGCRLDNKGSRLGSIGCIRVVQHRLLAGVPKSCTITRTATGKWFASISCDIGEYKAEEAGIGFKAVDPEYTSQDCSACGHREKKTLSQRVHHCKACGYTTDRDHNAAINILTLGLQRQAD